MRIGAVMGPTITMLTAFRLGLTPLQRVLVWGVVSMIMDLYWTFSGVAGTRIWMGITQVQQQRNVLQTAKTVGDQTRQAFQMLPVFFLGTLEKSGVSLYNMVTIGCLTLFPLSIFANLLPSFAKQRVDYRLKIKGEDQEGEPDAEKQPTFLESLAVVRHNKWFITNTIVSFLTIFTPGADGMHFYRYLCPPLKIGKKELVGTDIYAIKSTIIGLPGTFLQPFAVPIVKFFGGDLKFIRFNQVLQTVTTLVKYLVGYGTVPKLMIMFLLEMIQDIFGKIVPVPNAQMGYKALDYVEWKTGQRSEGMTMAVDGIFGKLISRNVDTLFSSAILDWTGFLGWDYPAQQQPANFMKTLWPFLHLTSFIDGVLWTVARFIYKYPEDPAVVEADLIERRALAKKMKEEAQTL
jgi:Na+/melibiose symporter-like transporter